MKQKKQLIDSFRWVVCLLYLLAVFPAHGQEGGRIQGTVVDSRGKLLQGVTVTANNSKGARIAVTTSNTEGLFSLHGLTAGERYIVRFSLIGYAGYEVSDFLVQAGDTNSILARLTEQATDLDEVIVTALGIKREEKALGYAQQTVNAEALATAVSTNWSEGLKGKVAGLNIISGSTGPINSQSIQLRGTTSLDPGGNAALIVIDGVPMNQETTAYGNNVGAAYGTEAPVDYGNAVSELRQEDIESVTVL